MSASGGNRAIIAAFLANMGIALAKFVAWFVSGSASMLAEAIHSVADSGNQLLLLLGGVTAAFAGGMTVFPGGGVDQRDFDHELEAAAWAGPSAEEWGSRLGVDTDTARSLDSTGEPVEIALDTDAAIRLALHGRLQAIDMVTCAFDDGQERFVVMAGMGGATWEPTDWEAVVAACSGLAGAKSRRWMPAPKSGRFTRSPGLVNRICSIRSRI